MRTLLLLLLSPLSLLITLLPYSSASPSPRTNPRFNDLPVDDDDAPKQNLQPGPQSRPHPTRAFVSGPVPQVLGTPIPLSPDPCGPPAGQDPRARPASESTCFSYVSKGLDDDHPFKLNCTTDKTGYTLNVENCRKSLNAVCSTLALGSFSDGVGRDRWVWAVAPVGAVNCTLGFWVPKGSALLPTYDRCKNDIFGPMISGCEAGGNANVGSVNLKRLPHRTENVRDTGMAVNPLYPSYIMVAQNSIGNAET